jgi:hypothetical protein
MESENEASAFWKIRVFRTELINRKPKTARKGYRRQDFRGEDYGYSK